MSSILSFFSLWYGKAANIWIQAVVVSTLLLDLLTQLYFSLDESVASSLSQVCSAMSRSQTECVDSNNILSSFAQIEEYKKDGLQNASQYIKGTVM